MASNRELVLYACAAEGGTTVAEFVQSVDPSLETIAAKCVQQAPPHHAVYSHTLNSRSYTFLIDERFVFFGIFDGRLEKGKRLWFLKQIRDGFEELLRKEKSLVGIQNLSFKCLQVEMEEVFERVLDCGVGTISNVDGLVRLGWSGRAKGAEKLELEKGCDFGLKKKKRAVSGEFSNGSRDRDIDQMDEEGSKEFTVLVNKHCNGDGGGRRSAARSDWRKRVWIVLVLDLFVCLVMFGAWLYICQGFKCLDR